MKKQFGKLALAVVLSMAVSLVAPAAQTAQAASKKTFTYAEQVSGDKVSTLVMDCDEQVDLKFIGIANYKNYSLKWTSTNEEVAVVDSNGVITAIGTGKAIIKLNVGDGSEYTSSGVMVYVNRAQKVTIGTASEDEIKSYVLELGKTVTLKANGLKDNVANRYLFEWSSTDTSVATVNEKGVITTVAPGLTVIRLTVKKKFNGNSIEAAPIALQVTAKTTPAPTSTPVPTAVPTKAPTMIPTATATPEPTLKPTAAPTPSIKPAATATPVPSETPTEMPTPTVTPSPEGKYVPYTAKLESESSILLTFDSKVEYSLEDIELNQLIIAGNSVYPVNLDIIELTTDSTGKVLRIVSSELFANGERYQIKAGPDDTEGTILNVNIGAPNRLELSYECFGKKGVAYTYDMTSAIDVPVTLSYRLYYGTIDVTETYSNEGYMIYELATNKYNENVTLADNILAFYAPNTTAVVNGTFTYYSNNGTIKEVKGSATIRSQKLPEYGISGVVKTTIIDGSTGNTAKIDWDSTTNQVIANTENSKVVAMLLDTYGNYYVTDERGVDKANKIYSIYDPEQLFFKLGYNIEFSAKNPNQIVVSSEGYIYPFKVTPNAYIIMTLTNNGLSGNSSNSRNIGACPVCVLEESRLTFVTVSEPSVILAASSLPGFEDRFCTTDLEVLLKDQYRNNWSGIYNLELSSNIPAVNGALDGTNNAPATLQGNTLHIDAKNIRRVTNSTTVTFFITESITEKKASITVTLQNPIVSNGEIKLNGWSVGIQNNKIILGEANADEWIQKVIIEAFKTSSNNVKVGLHDNLQILETANYSFTPSNCQEGEVYISVKRPDGKMLPQAVDRNSLGVYVDEIDHCVKVNVSVPIVSGKLVLDSLPAGTYTVTATKIMSVTNVVQKAVQVATFTVVDNTKEVTFGTQKSVSTPLVVMGKDDLMGVKSVIESVFTFNLDGKPWTDFNADMINDVDFIVNGNTLIIKKIEFAVPLNNSTIAELSYKKTCEVNKAIRMNVSQ